MALFRFHGFREKCTMKTMRGCCLFAALCGLMLPAIGNADDKKSPAGPQVVAKILKVEHAEQETAPPNLTVTATGQVSSGGFTKPTLLRATYVTPPEDGIQDYFLVAVPPSGPAIQVISEVKASDTWKGFRKEAPWIKGIRVHGVGEGIVVKMFGK
jgi:hypothetical protein